MFQVVQDAIPYQVPWRDGAVDFLVTRGANISKLVKEVCNA